jgi:hypothetical protein
MLTDKIARHPFITAAIMFAVLIPISLSAFLLPFRSWQKVTKGDVYLRVSEELPLGAGKSEVIRFLDSTEIKGFKAKRNDYERYNSNTSLTFSRDGKEKKVAGEIFAVYKDVGGGFMACKSVGVIFYFDESDKLVNWHLDCF